MSASSATAVEATTKATTSNTSTEAGGIAAVALEAASIEAATVEPTVVPAGIESPAKGAPERACTDKGVGPQVRVPIPAGHEGGCSGIFTGDWGVGLSQILRAQTAPVIELVLGRVRIELLRLLSVTRSNGQIVVGFEDDPMVIGLMHSGFALAHHRVIGIGVELIQAGLEQLCRYSTIDDLNVVLRIELIHFDGGSPALEFDCGVAQIG